MCTHTYAHTQRVREMPYIYYISLHDVCFYFSPIYIVVCLAYCAICSLARRCNCSRHCECSHCLHSGSVERGVWWRGREGTGPLGICCFSSCQQLVEGVDLGKVRLRALLSRVGSQFCNLGLIHEPNLISIRHSQRERGERERSRGGAAAARIITKKP